jgi:uncharacterized BrkB/YihY/UPF0761 family membrane protein
MPGKQANLIETKKMKPIHRFIVSIGASLGGALLIVSALSIAAVLKSTNGLPDASTWDFYMENFNRHLRLMPYLIAALLIVFLLFYVLDVHKVKSK